MLLGGRSRENSLVRNILEDSSAFFFFVTDRGGSVSHAFDFDGNDDDDDDESQSAEDIL
jgi:hypothetical protein